MLAKSRAGNQPAGPGALLPCLNLWVKALSREGGEEEESETWAGTGKMQDGEQISSCGEQSLLYEAVPLCRRAGGERERERSQ